MTFSEIIHKLAYIRSTLNQLHRQKAVRISRVAAIREILGPVHYQYDTGIPPRNSGSDAKRHSSVSETDKPVKHKKVKPASKTFLTPVVNRIAKDLFKGSLEVAEFGHDEEEYDITSTIRRKHKAHHTNPDKIIWGERLVEDEDIYSSVIVDGITYQVSQLLSFRTFFSEL
jgi:DNA (cytosine-5)-methyltransferase 1